MRSCNNAASTIVLVLAGVLLPSLAQAQSAAAEALFEEGRKLMDEGNYASACPKLKESYTIDPALGALLNLASCYEKAGKTATAWATYKDALGMASTADDTERADFARRHIEELEPRLTRLRIELAPGAELEGLTITRDDVAFSTSSVGTPLPVDPGQHRIAAEAPGHRGWSTTVETAEEGKAYEIVIPVLEAKAAPPPPPAPQPVVAPVPAPTPEEPEPSPGMSGLELAGWIVGGVGVASGIVGGVFGGLALSKGSQIADECTLGPGGNQCPTAELADENDTAMTHATLSNAFLIGGGVLVAGGVVMILLAPDGGVEVAEGYHLEPTSDGLRLRF